MSHHNKHYRTIFISDTHLGSRTANAEVLLDFLRHNHSSKIFIVGDFVDFWALRRGVYFPKSHKEVLRILLKRSARGTEIEYIPGNHDEVVRSFLPVISDNVKVLRNSEHITVDGKRLLITHGDDYDQVMKYARWLAWSGDVGYHGLIWANHGVNFIRRTFGFGYWSLSAWVKFNVKKIVNVIGDYEDAVVKHVVEKGFDGVITGHIHHAEIKYLQGILYVNCGDFVESCTAIVEEFDGTLKLIRWLDKTETLESQETREISQDFLEKTDQSILDVQE